MASPIRQSIDRRVAKKRVGRLTKLHGDLGGAGGKVLAGPEIERHAGPAPVVDAKFERDIRFGLRIRRDVRLMPVIASLFTEHRSGAVLAAYGIGGRDRMDRLEKL